MTEKHAPSLFTDELAESLKAKAGKPFRPCNGFEGDLFMSKWCALCAKDNYHEETGTGDCEIVALTMALDVDDEDYPAAWQIAESGQPICTEFEPLQHEGREHG